MTILELLERYGAAEADYRNYIGKPLVTPTQLKEQGTRDALRTELAELAALLEVGI